MEQSNNYTIAIIGASNKKESFGNKVLLNLTNRGYKVIPINPKYPSIEGIETYKDLSSIRIDYQIICFIVNDKISMRILEDNLDLIKNKFLWFQPGSYSDEIGNLLKRINHKSFECKSCIMFNKIEIF